MTDFIVNYKILNTNDELIEYFCSFFVERINSINKKKVHIALSGGKSPRLFLQRLASNKNINWNRLYLYQVDERCVPPDNDESNYKMIKESLLYNVNLPQENFHRMKGEDDPFLEAERYGDLITDNNIVFDIALLGIGSDGHTASIFPRQFFLYKYRDVTAVSLFPGSKQKRITLTEESINNADLKVFLVSGKEKSETIRKIFNKEDDDLPAGKIIGNTYWIIDSEAASNFTASLMK